MPNVLHCRAPPRGPSHRLTPGSRSPGREGAGGWGPSTLPTPATVSRAGPPRLGWAPRHPLHPLVTPQGLGTSPRSARPPGATAASVAPSTRNSLTLLLLSLSPVSFPSTSHISFLWVTADLLCERCYIWTVTRSCVAQNSHLIATPL